MTTGAFDDLFAQPAPTSGAQAGASTPGFDDLFEQPAAAAQTKPEPDLWSSKAGRFIQGAAEPMLGTAQLLSHATGIGTGYMDRKAREAAEAYQRSREAAGVGPSDWDIPATLGNILSPISAVPAARAARAISAAPTFIGALGRGAGLGALAGLQTPVAKPENQGAQTPGDYWATKGEQALLGGVMGGATGPVAELGARAVSPLIAEGTRDLVKKYGVDLTAGQTAGGFLKRAEDYAMSVPFFGQAVRDARARANESDYRAAINQTLANINKSLPDTVASGDDAINFMKSNFKSEYSNLFSNVALDRTASAYGRDLNNVKRWAKDALTEPQNKVFSDIFTNIINKSNIRAGRRGAGSPFTGSEVQEILTKIKDAERDYRGTPGPDNQNVGRALSRLRAAFEKSVSDQNPGFEPRYDAVSRGYAMSARVEAAAANPAAQEFGGIFTPTQLVSQVVRQDPTLRKRAVASGEALLQDFARKSKAALPAKVPDSGTPERGAMLTALAALTAAGASNYDPTGTAKTAALILGGGTGLAAAYQPWAQKILRNYLTSQAPWQKATAAGIRQTGQGLGMLAGRSAAQGFADGGEVAPEQSKSEAGWRSFATGATAGAWPYIEAAGKMAAGLGEGKDYETLRREAQGRLQAGREQYPAATDVATMAGGMVPLGGASSVAGAAARGAGLGGLTGYLSPVEPSSTDIEARAPSAGVGALFGGVTGGAAGAAGAAGRNLLQGKAPFDLGDAGLTMRSGPGPIEKKSNPPGASSAAKDQRAKEQAPEFWEAFQEPFFKSILKQTENWELKDPGAEPAIPIRYMTKIAKDYEPAAGFSINARHLENFAQELARKYPDQFSIIRGNIGDRGKGILFLTQRVSRNQIADRKALARNMVSLKENNPDYSVKDLRDYFIFGDYVNPRTGNPHSQEDVDLISRYLAKRRGWK